MVDRLPWTDQVPKKNMSYRGQPLDIGAAKEGLGHVIQEMNNKIAASYEEVRGSRNDFIEYGTLRNYQARFISAAKGYVENRLLEVALEATPGARNFITDTHKKATQKYLDEYVELMVKARITGEDRVAFSSAIVSIVNDVKAVAQNQIVAANAADQPIYTLRRT